MLNKKVKIGYVLRLVLLGIVLLSIAVMITFHMFSRKEGRRDPIYHIRERGYLVALTDMNTLNYFIYRGEPMGYQLILAEAFAKYLGIPLKIIASNDINKLMYYLRNNAADLIALNIPITPYGKKKIKFSAPFGETRLVLVQRKASGEVNKKALFIRSLKDFPVDTVYVHRNFFLAGLYYLFDKETRHNAILKEVSDTTQEELIRQVAEGKIHYALCFENVAMVYKRFYFNIDISVLAFSLFPYAWGVGHPSDSLCTKINDWIQKYKASTELKHTYIEYFDNQRIAGFLQSDYFSVISDKLSPYDRDIKFLSSWIHWDWRLLASLIYEESNFRPGQISSHKASGLMQLMPEIVTKYGLDSLSSPAQQIAAGVKYIHYIDGQLPEDIFDPIERIRFVLAAYNVGINRILAAREKAKTYGRNPNRWNGHVDYYLLRRSKKDPNFKTDTSALFPVDYKMEGFVDDIINRYYHYKNLIPE